jgi:hypothetical protein
MAPDGTLMHRKKRMKETQTLEAELLIDLQRAKGTLDRCRKHGSSTECLPAARSYLNALRAFSDLILNGKIPEKTKADG